MKSLKCFVYFLILIILGNFVLTGKEKVLPKAPTIKPPLPKRLPPPIKPPPPKWSDFKYNSEEEKEFWDSVPSVYEGNFSKLKSELVFYFFLSPMHYGLPGKDWRMDSMGGSIDKNSTKIGYSGFLKIMNSNGRFLAKFSNGKLDKVALWDLNGQKIYEYIQKDGVEKSWNPNGQKILERNYKDGKREGLETQWHPNGQKMSEENYKDGKIEGLFVAWYENGQKSWERNYKDGIIDGHFVDWHPNGHKMRESNYKDGKIEGLWVEWYENGQKKSEVNYKDGKVSGNTRYWTEDGKPTDKPEIRMPPRSKISIPKKQEKQDQ
jgi:antitoxin component YwqK of YwqJK toxin-antitoxin module